MPRIAKSLSMLRDQVDARWPGRDKSSDGWLGDTSHQARKSDHNPNTAGVVQALDVTHDPAHGLNARSLAEMLVASRDPRIKYIISNAQIISSKVSPWVWRPYSGPNEHRHHVHVSVDDDPALYDDARPWVFAGAPELPPAPQLPPVPPTKRLFTQIVATEFGGTRDPNNSAYDNHFITDTELGCALPARFGSPRPKVRVIKGDRSVVCSIVDVGPWNTRDPYWEHGARPQAESGVDLIGRRTNKAGIDLTPAAAHAIGLNGIDLVSWEFVGDFSEPAPRPKPTPAPRPSQPDTRNWLQVLIEAIGSIFKR
jgi:hypothetical protein